MDGEKTNSNMGNVASGMPRQYSTVEEIKSFRVDVDALIQRAEKLQIRSAWGHTKLSIVCDFKVFEMLTEAKMWLGKCLEVMGTEFPANLADKAPSNMGAIAGGSDKLNPPIK